MALGLRATWSFSGGHHPSFLYGEPDSSASQEKVGLAHLLLLVASELGGVAAGSL